MTVEQGGGGGGKGRGPETSKQPAGRPGPAGQGSAERPRKYSPVRRESRGTRTVVRVKGEGGGGADRETGTAGIEREVERQRRHAFPGDERRDDGLKTRRAPQESRGKSSVNEGMLSRATKDETTDSRPGGHRKNQEGTRVSAVRHALVR